MAAGRKTKGNGERGVSRVKCRGNVGWGYLTVLGGLPSSSSSIVVIIHRQVIVKAVVWLLLLLL